MIDEKPRAKQRLARVAHALLGGSYSRAKREVEVGHVTVNGRVATDPGAWVRPTDQIAHRPSLPRRAPLPAAPPITILHVDDDVVVIDKPSGLLVHPTYAGETDTVLTRTVAALAKRGEKPGRLHVVHRIDRDTSGVLVIARTHAAAEHLHRQFKLHTVNRRYLALVAGDLDESGMVERGIGRPRPGARRAALGEGRGREARTKLRPCERLGRVTLVEAELHTGRTHQVRVHLSWLNLPVLGDPLYGDPADDPVAAPRLALHAAFLGFVHPRTGQRLEFELPLPADLARVLALARRKSSPAPAVERPPRSPARPAARRPAPPISAQRRRRSR